MKAEGAIQAGLDLLQNLIRIETVPGAGRQGEEAARLLFSRARHFRLSSRLLEPRPGYSSCVVHLPGRGPDDLLLLSHLDVASLGEPGAWQQQPFSGALVDGEIWGRGAVDCKGLVAAWFAVLLMLRDKPLRRGMVLAATADEESGGTWGTRWFLEHCPEASTCRWALNEGGGWGIKIRGKTFITCQVGEKGYIHIRCPGSASNLYPLAMRLKAHLPAASLRFLTAATGVPGFVAAKIGSAGASRLIAWFERSAPEKVNPDDLFFHTCRIAPSPGDCSTELKCWVLPGSRTTDVATSAAGRFGLNLDRGTVLEQIEPSESPLNSELYSTIAQTSGLQVLPLITPGRSDSLWLRRSGIPVYGFFPGPNARHVALQHMANERLSVDSFGGAVITLHNLLARFCT